jgi:ribosomal protein S13
MAHRLSRRDFLPRMSVLAAELEKQTHFAGKAYLVQAQIHQKRAKWIQAHREIQAYRGIRAHTFRHEQ